MRPSQAACYSPAEYEAEQGLRIQSKLMVIALNCQHMPYKSGNLYMSYRQMSMQNKALFDQYDQTLRSFYNRNGGGAEHKLNNLRTEMANNVSVMAAQTRPDIFCYKNKSFVTQALNMSSDQFRQWAARGMSGAPSSYPQCR
jgi:hypothetical protein